MTLPAQLFSAPQLTTHPVVVLAAANVFRDWGAEVTVGEAPGHVRDTEMALVESGLKAALVDAKLPFADLNYENVEWTPNRFESSATVARSLIASKATRPLNAASCRFLRLAIDSPP